MSVNIKKVALLISVMEPRLRRDLMADLPKDMAGRIESEIAVVRGNAWNSAALVSSVLAETMDDDVRDGLSVERLVLLSRVLDSRSYSRLVLSADLHDADFLLSLLEPGFSAAVRARMLEYPQMPQAVRAAVVQAAQRMLPGTAQR